MFGLPVWGIVTVISLCGGAWFYTNSLISTNKELKADVENYRTQEANYILAIDSLQAEVRLRAKAAEQYRKESEERQAAIRVVNRRLENVLKSNSRWSDPDLPSDINKWLCGVEAKTSAGSDPAVCPAGETGTNPNPETRGQESRRDVEGAREFHASTRRMQRGQASDSSFHYSTTKPETGEYQQINKALIARNREQVK